MNTKAQFAYPEYFIISIKRNAKELFSKVYFTKNTYIFTENDAKALE